MCYVFPSHAKLFNYIQLVTGPVYLVVELAEYGSLLDFLHNNQMYSISHQDKVSILTESQKIRIGRDVARGLEHLARSRVRTNNYLVFLV